MKELIWKEAEIISSRVSHGEFARAIDELSKGSLKTQKAFELLQSKPEEHLKILLEFRK